MIETVYSSFAGVEIPVNSIYIMTWKANLGTRYSVIINENTSNVVDVMLVTDNYMQFSKIVQTTRDEEIVIDIAVVDLEAIQPVSPLLESAFYEELDDETKSEVDNLIAEIIKYHKRVQSSNDVIKRYNENMSEQERMAFPQFLEDSKKLDTRVRRLEKARLKLVETVEAESILSDTALSISDARKSSKWSDYLEAKFQQISDPDVRFAEDNAFNDSSNEEDDTDIDDTLDSVAEMMRNQANNTDQNNPQFVHTIENAS